MIFSVLGGRHVQLRIELTPFTVKWLKSEAERNGIPFYELPLDQRDMMINKYGFVEGTHFSCERDPIRKLDGEITYLNGEWKETVYG